MELIDNTALYKISYGLYVLTTNDGIKDNGMICNTVMQVTSEPLTVVVGINKANYSCQTVIKTGKMNVVTLTEKCDFSIFERFGFASGKDKDKFEGLNYWKSQNGLPVLVDITNSFISLEVKHTIDLGTHYLFVCGVTEAKTINNDDSMTYDYYHKNVKRKVDTTKKGYVCTICGYIYEGDPLPEDFICPICKYPASAFKKL